MRTLACSLVALMLWALPVTAAPAPFPKPSAELDGETVIAQLKQFLLRERGAHADQVRAGGNANEWLVVGNTPTLSDGGMMYEQRYYRIAAHVTDRRGSLRFEVIMVTRPRPAITR